MFITKDSMWQKKPYRYANFSGVKISLLIKFPNYVSLFLVISPRHLYTVLLHHLHLLISPLLGLHLNPKFQRSLSVVPNPNKQSDSDHIPIWLVKECSSVFIPTVTNVVNLSQLRLVTSHSQTSCVAAGCGWHGMPLPVCKKPTSYL